MAIYYKNLWFLLIIAGLICPLTMSRAQQINETQILALDGSMEDNFGNDVDIDGDMAIVGARYDDPAGDNSGSAYIYQRIEGTWTQQAKLTASDGAANDLFGNAVSISGDFVIIGAMWDDDAGTNSGSAYIFERDGDEWDEVEKLSASVSVEFGEFGRSVDIDGDFVIIGEPNGSPIESGIVYIYQRDGASWVPFDQLAASDAATGQSFGSSVAISGSFAIVGARQPGMPNGQAYVFQLDGDIWIEEDRLTSAEDGEWFARQVDIDGSRAVVSAHGADDMGENAGAVYVYLRSGSSWIMEEKLFSGTAEDYEWLGVSIAIDDDIIVAGAPTDEAVLNSAGFAVAFRNDPFDSWIEEAHFNSAEGAAFDEFGVAVAVSGDDIIVGAHESDINGINSGAAFLYDNIHPLGILQSDDSEHNLGEAMLGSTHIRTLQVHNSGRMQLAITDFTIEPADPDVFFVDDSPLLVLPGDSRDIDVTFIPNTTGNFDATLTLISTGGNVSVELVGQGIAPPPETKVFAGDGSEDDGFGRVVDFSAGRAVIAARDEDDNGAGSGAVYVFEQEGTQWTESAKLLASDGDANDIFGNALAIDRDYLIVAAREDEDNGANAGAVYMFEHNGAEWVEVDKLLADDGNSGDNFGWSVALQGDYAVVGATFDSDLAEEGGSAYVFKRTDGIWVQQTKLTSNGVAAFDRFGRSVAIDGDYIAVGAPSNENLADQEGSVYIFQRSGEEWNQTWIVQPDDGHTDNRFGVSVALSGNKLLAGSDGDNDNGFYSGAAYVFDRNGTSWVQKSKIKPDQGAQEDFFGRSVSISGDYALIGAFMDDAAATNAGAAYLYKFEYARWEFETKLIADDAGEEDLFGLNVLVEDELIIVGSLQGDGNENNSGAAYFYGDFGTVGIDDEAARLPRQFELDQNYPNPFNPTTVIGYSLQVNSSVTLDIYNVRGAKIRRLVGKSGVPAANQPAGHYSVTWDGTHDDGHLVASGMYFYQLIVKGPGSTANAFTETRKMLLVR